jgi:hypothetical protein
MDALQAVEEALTRLNRLGVMIRHSSRGNIAARANWFATGHDMVFFENLSFSSIEVLYPNAHKALRHRLSKSMVGRYATMVYVQSRQSTPQTSGTKPSHVIPIITESNEAGVTRPPNPLRTQPSSIATPSTSLPASRSKPGAPSSESDLSSWNTTLFRKMVNSPYPTGLPMHKTSSLHVNQGKYPQPPEKEDATIVTCKWCSEPLTKEAVEGSNWR